MCQLLSHPTIPSETSRGTQEVGQLPSATHLPPQQIYRKPFGSCWQSRSKLPPVDLAESSFSPLLRSLAAPSRHLTSVLSTLTPSDVCVRAAIRRKSGLRPLSPSQWMSCRCCIRRCDGSVSVWPLFFHHHATNLHRYLLRWPHPKHANDVLASDLTTGFNYCTINSRHACWAHTKHAVHGMSRELKRTRKRKNKDVEVRGSR